MLPAATQIVAADARDEASLKRGLAGQDALSTGSMKTFASVLRLAIQVVFELVLIVEVRSRLAPVANGREV